MAPDSDTLDDDERRFLKLVAPIGIDWQTSGEQYRARFGTCTYFGTELIAFAETTALSELPLVFRCYQYDLDLPPYHFFADVALHANVADNRAAVEPSLIAKLGAPTELPCANGAQMCKWSFGIFTVWLTNVPGLVSPGLGGAAPQTALTVMLVSDYAQVFPDRSLNALVELIDRGAAQSVRMPNPVAMAPSFEFSRETRRNPKALSSLIASDECVPWRSESHWILSMREESLVFPVVADAGLALLEFPGERGGPNEEELYLELPGKTPIRLYGGEVAHDAVATAWQIPLRKA